MRELADEDGIGEQTIKMPAAERPAAGHTAVPLMADFAPHAPSIQFGLESPYRTLCQVELKDFSDQLGFGRVDQQFPISKVIAERHGAAHPDALGLGLGDFVADTCAFRRKAATDSDPKRPLIPI